MILRRLIIVVPVIPPSAQAQEGARVQDATARGVGKE